jgi:hypothetical protein
MGWKRRFLKVFFYTVFWRGKRPAWRLGKQALNPAYFRGQVIPRLVSY